MKIRVNRIYRKLNTSYAGVYKLLREKKIKAEKINGTWKIDSEDFKRYLKDKGG
jgi:excisionase family DNA binding protein